MRISSRTVLLPVLLGCLIVGSTLMINCKPTQKTALPASTKIKELPAVLTDPGAPEMVLIPASEAVLGFNDEDSAWMTKEGSDFLGKYLKDVWFTSNPRRTLRFKAFYIGKYEVTNEEYAKFVKESGHPYPRVMSNDGSWFRGSWIDGIFPEGLDRHPVIFVSWQDANSYCAWLNKKTGKHYRLPTADEWEKAASWDEKNKRKLRFPWGDALQTWEGAIRDIYDCIESVTCSKAVGSTPVDQSPYGVFDMGGNVAEWVGKQKSLTGSATLKGGSFVDNDPILRWLSAIDRTYPADEKGSHVWRGFRILREI